MNVIFLDIDGVLNCHKFNSYSECCIIEQDKVQILNHILDKTDSKIVLSSAWRYMVHVGDLTLAGMDYLFRSHGIKNKSLYGITCTDEEVSERKDQISRFLLNHKNILNWVVIDDEPDGMIASPNKERFIKTDGNIGLTFKDAKIAISILKNDI